VKTVEECLKKNRLKRATISTEMIQKELAIGKEDFSEAANGLERKAFKWTTIQAYYSTFHAMRALLFKAGYREESHSALKIGIKELYVISGKLSEESFLAFERGMELRELADYKATFSEETARWLVEHGKTVIEEVEELIK